MLHTPEQAGYLKAVRTCRHLVDTLELFSEGLADGRSC